MYCLEHSSRVLVVILIMNCPFVFKSDCVLTVISHGALVMLLGTQFKSFGRNTNN